jgi:hypothetical protein
MENDTPSSSQTTENPAQARSAKILSPAAQRALAEAEARRKTMLEAEAGLPTEVSGRGGLDPARYGDWEIKGLTSDF